MNSVVPSNGTSVGFSCNSCKLRSRPAERRQLTAEKGKEGQNHFCFEQKLCPLSAPFWSFHSSRSIAQVSCFSFFHRWNNSEFAGCLWQALLAPSYSVCSLTVRTLREQSRMLRNLSSSPSHTHIALQTWQEVVAVLEELRFLILNVDFFCSCFSSWRIFIHLSFLCFRRRMEISSAKGKRIRAWF